MPICAGCAREILPDSIYKKCNAPGCHRNFHTGCTCGQHRELFMRRVNGAERVPLNYNNYRYTIRRNSSKITGIIMLIIGTFLFITSLTRCVSLIDRADSGKINTQSKASEIEYATIIPPLYSDNNIDIKTYKGSEKEPVEEISCSGAPRIRLTIDEDARICTNGENLRLRSYPSIGGGKIIKSYVPGTLLWIIEGPECSNKMYWWKVRAPDGKIGWMAEGGPTKTTYYLCPN